jgi:hypothetical protein
MSRWRSLSLSPIAVATLGICACDQASVAPATTPAAPTALEARGSSAPTGFYTMTFLHYGQEVTTLPAGPYSVSHILVKVHVEDINHQPVQSGSVLYEVCTYKGTGKSAPSAACADGTARWAREVNVEVNPKGDTYAGRDAVRVPCVMGWRATYSGSQTTAPGKMGPVDFIWTAQ